MALSKTTLEELTRELERLREKATALQGEVEERTQRLTALHMQITGIQALISNEQKPQAMEGSSSKSIPGLMFMSFRDQIRAVMNTATGPLRPVEVADLMRKFGIPETSGKTDLPTRVTVELHKLAKVGEFRRMNGKYFKR